jgi:hypothetical protein
MWKYVQSTGDIYRNDVYVDTGYSGSGAGRNNPSQECVIEVGPIPAGYYTIGSEVEKPTPVTLPLSADDPNYCNPPRSGFLIHGDNQSGNASTGCVVLKRSTRETIRDSGDSRLRVVSNTMLSARAARTRQRRRHSSKRAVGRKSKTKIG